uniref:ent-kaurene synthase n=1 Tax=Grindelia hirsutula TaxID=1114741 RepID=R9UM72_9ASTR|nr:manoyl oxide synthase [Grindelia hirsutula]
MMLLSSSSSWFTVVPSSHKSRRLLYYYMDPSILEQPQYYPSTHICKASSRNGQANQTVLSLDATKEGIRKLFNNVDYSISAYDTAWVAMVPSPNSPISPCFPDCLKWLLDNQHKDGSWGLCYDYPLLLKDSLSSTLAGIVALKRWNVGEDQIKKGLHFIESNCASATDMNQTSPFGFEIIFPHMLQCAKDLNIKLPFKQIDLSLMLNRRELELRRCFAEDIKGYLAYISEGLGNLYDHDMVMKYQMKNGSILNSPSATSAVLIRHQNVRCMNYLSQLLEKFGNSVPTLYPHGLYVRLCMVDALKRLGITRHFRMEIQDVLDQTYRCWVQNDEQIFMDVATCALAFRVLRTNGYDVSSDPLAEMTKMAGASMNSHNYTEAFKGVYAALEVYRATHVIHEDVLSFEDERLRSKKFLQKIISTTTVPSNRHSEFIHEEVDNALKFPFNGCLERISTRRNIEHYNVDNTRIWKTAYRSPNIANEGYLRLAVEDFNTTQSIYRAEVQSLERWMEENKLNNLKFARQNSAYCYFSVAATLSSPQLSDARISWAKNSILVTIVDDFFDVGGSMDEFANLIQCVERWEVNVDTDCISNEVRIIFLAIKDIVCWSGDAAFERQGRDVKCHVIEIWLRMLKNMWKEAIWVSDAGVPTINEYMENGYVTIGIGPTLLPALYFVGPSLSQEIVQSSEYEKLFELVSTQGRLLNDIQTFKRELKVGKLNAVPLHMIHGKTGITEEEVVDDIKMVIEKKRRELLKLVMEAEGSVVPRACKDAFWDMSNVLNLFYATDDGFSGSAILDIVQDVIYKPISIPPAAGHAHSTFQL